jgi:hypothetical protein
LYDLPAAVVNEIEHLARSTGGIMVLTFYLGAAALQFKQYAAYVQRRTATRAAQLVAPD